MRILINALSVGSLSGVHVLFGHLTQLSRMTEGAHEFVVLHHPHDSFVDRCAATNVSWQAAPAGMQNWLKRSIWESVCLPRNLRNQSIDLMFTPSGTAIPNCPIPQISLAQNPWCLVPGLHQSATQRLKAGLQRRAYRQAMRTAALMIYNSHHIESLYRANAGGSIENSSAVVYQAIDDETHVLADAARRSVSKHPGRILSVSAMAHWKGVETGVQALAELRRRGIEAQLRLVGPWPDSSYERLVRSEICRLKLGDHVTITGQVSREQLHREYAEATVFCLMSRCESFGIPAVEAQAFGTPVVGSDVCAMPEICGDGGRFAPAGDALATTDLLEPLLTNPTHWNTLSQAAVSNADRFRWSLCSAPLKDLLSQVGRTAGLAAC